MTADPWSTFLADRRAAYQTAVDGFAGRGWQSRSQAWDEAGPTGIEQLASAEVSREALALIAFAEEIASLADCCAGNRGEGPTVNRTWLVQRIREALTALATNPEESKHD